MVRVADAPGVPAGLGWQRKAFVQAVRGWAWLALIGVLAYVVHQELHRPRLPRGVVGFVDIVYRRAAGRVVRLDLYLPETPPPPGGRPVVLAIHGGGWRGGSKTGYGREIARLAEYGCIVVAPDYQLSRPGVPSWPENLEDLREAVRWVRRHAADYGADPDRIAALGASAGAHLAILLGTNPEVSAGRPSGADGGRRRYLARVQAVVAFYGPTDLRSVLHQSPSAWIPVALLLGGSPAEMPQRYEAASPASHVSEDDPPMLLIYGQADRLVPPDQAQALHAALNRAGVPHRLLLLHAGHGFGLQVGSRDLVPEILAFLQTVWKH